MPRKFFVREMTFEIKKKKNLLLLLFHFFRELYILVRPKCPSPLLVVSNAGLRIVNAVVISQSILFIYWRKPV